MENNMEGKIGIRYQCMVISRWNQFKGTLIR